MIITKEKRNDFVSWLDGLIDFTKVFKKIIVGGTIELIDGLLFGACIDFLNEDVEIPEKFHDNINDFIDACLVEDFESILLTIPNLQQDIKNIKALSDDLETRWVATNIEATVEFIKYLAEKNRG